MYRPLTRTRSELVEREAMMEFDRMNKFSRLKCGEVREILRCLFHIRGLCENLRRTFRLFGFQRLIYYSRQREIGCRSLMQFPSATVSCGAAPLLQVAISPEYRTHVNCQLETAVGTATPSGFRGTKREHWHEWR